MHFTAMKLDTVPHSEIMLSLSYFISCGDDLRKINMY